MGTSRGLNYFQNLSPVMPMEYKNLAPDAVSWKPSSWAVSGCSTLTQLHKSTVLLEKLLVPSLVKKFPTLYGVWRFITVVITTCHLCLSWSKWIQTKRSHSIFLKSIFTFSSHPYSHFPSGLLPSGFSTNTQYAFPSSPVLKTRFANLTLLDVTTQICVKESYTATYTWIDLWL